MGVSASVWGKGQYVKYWYIAVINDCYHVNTATEGQVMKITGRTLVEMASDVY